MEQIVPYGTNQGVGVVMQADDFGEAFSRANRMVFYFREPNADGLASSSLG
jgi:hypothetical protein